MPLKKEKKIIKKPVKKGKSSAKGKTQTQKSKKQTQTQSIVVNIGRRSSSKGKQVMSKVPSAKYQASESPYPSYVRQSAVFPVEQNESVLNTIGQTVGPIPNRLPVFPEAPQQPIDMEEEETFMRPPLNRNRIPKPKTKTDLPVMIPDEDETFIRTPMPEESPSEVMLRIGSEPQPQPIYQPINQPNIRIGRKIQVRLPKPPSEPPTRKARVGSRRDLQERYFMKTGSRWADVSNRKERAADTDKLRGIVKDLEAGVAR